MKGKQQKGLATCEHVTSLQLRGTVCHSDVQPNEEIIGYVQKANEYITDPDTYRAANATTSKHSGGATDTNGPVCDD